VETDVAIVKPTAKGKDPKKKQTIQIALMVLLILSGIAIYLTQFSEKPACAPSKGELMQQEAIKNRDSKKIAEAAELMRKEAPRSQRCPE